MSAQELQCLLTTVLGDINTGASIIAGLDPALVPYVALGRALDTAIPGLAATVSKWITGEAPTAEEVAAQAAQLAVLGDPRLP